MTTGIMSVEKIPSLDHDEAMALAEAEYARLLALADELSPQEWQCPTDCTGWSVRDVVGHLLGMVELQADPGELRRQIGAAAAAARESGELRLTELTALQVREHAHLSTGELRAELREAVPRGLAARRALSAERRATPYDPQLPGEGMWTLGYLFDVIHTRDPWMHRIDICRATGREAELSREHDGRIVADVVAEWAGRHGEAFDLELTGPAGGRFRAGHGGGGLRLDAVEFCRVLSGRAAGAGPLATRVTF